MDHDPAAYGRQTAQDYDTVYGDWPDTADAVATLLALAGAGPVLEFGIGTGRLALPLVAGGLRVAGIEGSPEMLEQLRARPGGDSVDVVCGDFSEATVAGSFSLVVLAVNTVFALASPDAQVACFANAARHLAPRGRFLVEAFVLTPAVEAGEQGIEVRRTSSERVELQLSQYDPGSRRIRRVLVNLANNEAVRVHTVNDQYASPGELDVMAEKAGLELEDRWSTWARDAWLPTGRRHISVYRRS